MPSLATDTPGRGPLVVPPDPTFRIDRIDAFDGLADTAGAGRGVAALDFGGLAVNAGFP